MNVEFNIEIKLKGKMSLRHLLILVVSGALIVGNLMSTNPSNIINKVKQIESVITTK
ncbi:hypothetical protein NIES4071_103630 (plasmid) [Calothrix sp. NIES-4071]|nr:hypothetical protein NIES4071_103630 [Calothrix sp. NIES-4071]BAZ64350.1 hypothetical protein NIES4105_100830 [Calothrix sp. NIES-4105]